MTMCSDDADLAAITVLALAELRALQSRLRAAETALTRLTEMDNIRAPSQGDPLSFGQVLKRCRLRMGFSQERLAEEAGLSVAQISDLERDRRARPHPDTLLRLACALRLADRERETFVALARSEFPRIA